MRHHTLRFALAAIAFLLAPLALAAEYGTAEEARAMLDRVVAAMQADPAGALAKFNSGEDGFKDRDLYPFCVGADGVTTAHPTLVGTHMSEIKDVDGKMLVEEMVKIAEEAKIVEVEYKWPRPGSTEPVPKVSYVTKIGDQVCGVGYYK
jgi:signal transduction histidine kinase